MTKHMHVLEDIIDEGGKDWRTGGMVTGNQLRHYCYRPERPYGFN